MQVSPRARPSFGQSDAGLNTGSGQQTNGFGVCRVLMQKVAKEYMSTMKAAAVQGRLKAGQAPIKATAATICSPDIIQQCFAARDGRLLGLLVSLLAAFLRKLLALCSLHRCNLDKSAPLASIKRSQVI